MATKKLFSHKDARTTNVDEYLTMLEHPLKPEIEAVRAIIVGANQHISERIKWNAPSFFYLEDIATFNPRNQNAVHIVFHHESIVRVASALLHGDYKDRRQKTEDRRQKTEDRRQKTEDRRQKTEDRRQKTEDRRQKTEE
jgi:uncharacterized protein YdhG (YjbR/CyaY superfamily)